MLTSKLGKKTPLMLSFCTLAKTLFPKEGVQCFGLTCMLDYCMGTCYLNRHLLTCSLEKLGLLCLLLPRK